MTAFEASCSHRTVLLHQRHCIARHEQTLLQSQFEMLWIFLKADDNRINNRNCVFVMNFV